MSWPDQFSDLNPIELLCGDVKKYVAEKQPSNAEELWNTVRDAWHHIPLKRYQNLIDSMRLRLWRGQISFIILIHRTSMWRC